MKNLNIIIPIRMYSLTIDFESALFFTKREHHDGCITTTLTNHKQCCSLGWVSDGISQNLLSQNFDVVQSDIAEYTVAKF